MPCTGQLRSTQETSKSFGQRGFGCRLGPREYKEDVFSKCEGLGFRSFGFGQESSCCTWAELCRKQLSVLIRSFHFSRPGEGHAEPPPRRFAVTSSTQRVQYLVVTAYSLNLPRTQILKSLALSQSGGSDRMLGKSRSCGRMARKLPNPQKTRLRLNAKARNAHGQEYTSTAMSVAPLPRPRCEALNCKISGLEG